MSKKEISFEEQLADKVSQHVKNILLNKEGLFSVREDLQQWWRALPIEVRKEKGDGLKKNFSDVMKMAGEGIATEIQMLKYSDSR